MIEKAKEQIKAKKDDEKELKEIRKANLGLITKKKTPPHVIEGENAKAYVEHTINKSEEFAETHKQRQDEEVKDKIREHKAAKEAFESNPKNA